MPDNAVILIEEEETDLQTNTDKLILLKWSVATTLWFCNTNKCLGPSCIFV